MSRKPRVFEVTDDAPNEAFLLHDYIIVTPDLQRSYVYGCPGVRVYGNLFDVLPDFPRHLLGFCLDRYVTDQYCDAMDTFSDVIEWFGAHEYVFYIALSPRDRALPEMLGGPLPHEVYTVFLTPSRANEKYSYTGRLVLAPRADDEDHDRLLGVRSSPCSVVLKVGRKTPQMGPKPFPVGAKAETSHEVANLLAYMVETKVCVRVAVKKKFRRRVALFPGWWRGLRFDTMSACGFCFLPLIIAGPLSTLKEQKALIDASFDSEGSFTYEILPPGYTFDFGRCFCDVIRRPMTTKYYWAAVSRLLVTVTSTLAQLERSNGEWLLSDYPILWICNYLPGVIFQNDVRKLACIKGMKDLVRGKLEERRARVSVARTADVIN